MATGFLTLPLEIRNKIYDYALEEEHDYFVKGVQALLKISPSLTREIYYYRKIVTTLPILRTDYRQSRSLATNPEQTAYGTGFWSPRLDGILDKVKKFEEAKDRKGLVVRCGAVSRQSGRVYSTCRCGGFHSEMGMSDEQILRYLVKCVAEGFKAKGLESVVVVACLLESEPAQDERS
ncbi:hypothetical protein AUEXF2481DRAFT_24884 [Aureobasidium subglaciale EXF-2481]|uniref:Uncharacterized protein n=1 Tax=Aureobasidium subglaciale (strain EXF-2481) TaxID=1043005 RepID=A0A074ZQK9_AURSE|nr:uncharacterized protein AUEXF2481DRAFT_24884 [Aureobasidium subglaciale EXF-2481]KER00572.1 hypothetical protein AUEXF2481DRAFT_24884 [Aureobasidium subglaciale EXF-2481]